MPFKFHEPRRHRVPKARYRVTNWPDYDRGLVGRGDLRLWIADDALAAWAAPRRRTRGGQARFSDLAIETVLVLARAMVNPGVWRQAAACSSGLVTASPSRKRTPAIS